jgi:hypothetical protein
MKALSVLFLLAIAIQPLAAEGLSNSDREALLEKLENIRKEADSKVDARFRTATSAFKNAMGSPNSALDLYLKCEEMVNFDDMKKKNVDFREWKRRNAEKLSDQGFRVALQQQLRWLVLTLEAASEDPDRDKLAAEAGKVVDFIVSKAEDLSQNRSVLEQGVTGSVFAQAYDINGVKVENWPLAPGQIQAVYEQVLLPPLRRMDRLASLKATWTRRMSHEGTLINLWGGNQDEKGKSGSQSPAYEKFITAALPNLQWDAEMDLFKAGDERGAAIRMLEHIQKNIAHDSAPKWTESFVALIQKEDAPDPEVETNP